MNDDSQPAHPIRVVARLTGLSPHVIRMWERRYAAVDPLRTPSNRRMYSEADIARLRLLRHLTNVGHAIGQIAGLPNGRLEEMAARDQEVMSWEGNGGGESENQSTATELLNASLTAIHDLDAQQLERVLGQSAVRLNALAVLDQVVGPLLAVIGERWREGRLRVAQEHVASAVVRTFLGDLLRTYDAKPGAPHLVISTPPRQEHELGALMAAVVAASEGWAHTYLGPNIPVEEIAVVAGLKESRAIALSLIYPPDDPLLVSELRKLRRLAPKDVAILAGGAAASNYGAVLRKVKATVVTELMALPEALRALREPGPPAATTE